MTVVVGIACAAGLCLSACAGEPHPAGRAPTPTSTETVFPPTAPGDLDFWLAQLRQIHPDPFHGVAEATFVAALNKLKAELSELSPQQLIVEVTRVNALLSSGGRDGHQWATPADGHSGPALPLRVYEFAEGVTITAATSTYQELVGSEIVAINGHPIGDVLAAIEPLVPRDGPSTVPDFRPPFLVRTDILTGLGLAREGPVELTLSRAGVMTTTTVAPVDYGAYLGWVGELGAIQLPERDDTLYLSDEQDVLWSKTLPTGTEGSVGSSVYLRFTQVRVPENQALADARIALAAPDVQRVVLDLRQNPGGDNHANPTITSLLTDYRQAHSAGAIVVITDRGTFSAAANLATDVEQMFHPTFVGEPMGGGLNFWDDVRSVRLDNLAVPMRVAISTKYWQESGSDDPRLTIQPQITLPVTAADYFDDRDPALAAALTVTAAQP